MARILIVEDEKKLVRSAEKALGKGYEVEDVDISQVNDVAYWESLGVSPADLVILDLNLRHPRYSGKDVLERLQTGKRAGKLDGLDKVLVATSIQGEVNPASVSPEIALASGFDVYGLEKGADASGRTTPSGYGESIAVKVVGIYAGSETPLNEGWRGE